MEHTYIKKLNEIYESNVSKPGLLRIIELLKRLGNPHNELKCVHVAGTNGKGSTCAYIESVLRTAGYKTGLFTSPHIYGFTEYIKINNNLVEEDIFEKYLEKTFTVCDEMVQNGFDHPSFFEIITATSFNYFSEEEVDIAIIEAGMGGTLDATNVILPIISVITSISYDHMEYLGNSLIAIAKHKAGIIKVNTPVVLAPRQKNSVQSVIKKHCRKMNAKLYNTHRHAIDIYHSTLDEQRFALQTDQDFYRIHINTAGRHQADNVTTAICTVQKLQEMNFDISYSDIKSGLSCVILDSRIEHVKEKNTIIDGSHNAQEVFELKRVILQHLPQKKIVLVCAMSDTKDVLSMVEEYKQFVDFAMVTQSTHALSMKANALAELFKSKKIPHEIYSDVKSALESAKQKAVEENAYLVISGSFYMIAEAKDALEQLYSEN